MTTLHAQVQAAIHAAFIQQYPQHTDVTLEITQSTQAKFGDYQCNSAMRLTKILGQPPREIAAKIAANLENHALFEHVEIAGPGFLNLRLNTAWLGAEVKNMLTTPRLNISPTENKQRIIVDFSSPNIAKEMHVGHLRSTIIGNCLARLFEFLGYDVLRLNHVGDWGTAFGMLIAYLQAEAPQVLSGEQTTTLPDLMQWYRAAKARFDTDADFKKQSQIQVISLQSGEPVARRAWEIICAISEKAYQEIYDLLDVQLLSRGESFYNPFLADILQDLQQKGLLTRSDGAQCMTLEGFFNREGAPLPLMLQKSDGGYNYDTTDMAAIRHRIEEEHADRILYITDAGQSLHFQMIFAAAEKAGYLDPRKTRVDHVPFGLVLGPDGKKFKTRSGETERLIDLLHQAVAQSRQIIEDREMSLSESEKDTLAQVLGIDAVKYADLSCHRAHDYSFSYERMLRFEGNTAAFLLYAYVRIASIQRKTTRSNVPPTLTLTHPQERQLALQVRQFEDLLWSLAEDLLPNRLADYLYNLANQFNQFFRDCRVEGDERQEERVWLCEATAQVLKTGLHILGLNTVDRM